MYVRRAGVFTPSAKTRVQTAVITIIHYNRNSSYDAACVVVANTVRQQQRFQITTRRQHRLSAWSNNNNDFLLFFSIDIPRVLAPIPPLPK